MLCFFSVLYKSYFTDNGFEFTNRLQKSKTGNSCQKLSKADVKCIDNNIQYRLTAPFTPKTNGMVERVNGIIKNNTILKTQYQSLEEMKKDLSKFLTFYNLYRRHGSIRKELKI
jgi:transposase InsO family protein